MASVRSPASGTSPMFLAAKEMLRLTRLPQFAAVLRMNSVQVKSVS